MESSLWEWLSDEGLEPVARFLFADGIVLSVLLYKEEKERRNSPLQYCKKISHNNTLCGQSKGISATLHNARTPQQVAHLLRGVTALSLYLIPQLSGHSITLRPLCHCE